MKRRIGREDLKAASPYGGAMELERPGAFLWPVYDDYELKGEGVEAYLEASTKKRSFYMPFIETPYLLLEFARLMEHKNQGEAMINWVSKRGLLGLSTDSSRRLEGPLFSDMLEESPEVSIPPLKYEYKGGRGDTLDALASEAWRIQGNLRLYEAAASQDIDALEESAAKYPLARLREQWVQERQKAEEVYSGIRDPIGLSRPTLGKSILTYESLDQMRNVSWLDFLVNEALLWIWQRLGAALSVYAYPTITTRGHMPLKPGMLKASWWPRNLLGVIYLQFYWLMTSAGELSRCKYCNRIIAYAQPGPDSGQRKLRKDKEFCDSRCRQNYHYHNVKKPKRNAERNGRND